MNMPTLILKRSGKSDIKVIYNIGDTVGDLLERHRETTGNNAILVAYRKRILMNMKVDTIKNDEPFIFDQTIIYENKNGSKYEYTIPTLTHKAVTILSNKKTLTVRRIRECVFTALKIPVNRTRLFIDGTGYIDDGYIAANTVAYCIFLSKDGRVPVIEE